MIVKSSTDRKIEHFKNRLGMVGDVYLIDHFICDRVSHQAKFGDGFAKSIPQMETEARNFLVQYDKANKVTTIMLKDLRSDISKALNFHIAFCAEDKVYDFSDGQITNINKDDFLVLIIGALWKYSDAPVTLITPDGVQEYKSFATTLEKEIEIPLFRTVEIICRNAEDNPKHLIFEVNNYGKY